MKRNILILIFVLAVLASDIAMANSPFQILRAISSARGAALAGCMVSMTNDPSAVFYNPATISTVENKRLNVTFFKHELDINSGNIAYVREFEEIGVLAAGINFTNYGSFDYADDQGNRDGRTFSANDLSFGLSYSNMLDSNLYWGATAKFVFFTLEEVSASAFAVDAGLLYRLKDDRTNIGISVLHVGTQLSKMNGYDEALPLDIRAGVNHRLRGLPLLINFTFHHLGDSQDNFFDKFQNFAVGGEIYLGRFIMARLGYDNAVRNYASVGSKKGLSGFSAGIGIKIDELNFDYGFARYGSAANLHRFSIALDIE